MSSETSSKRSGRRPGPTTTRDAVAEAARRQFAELDAALVVRFHGSKEGLFREVMALPPATAAAMAGLAEGPRETVGRRFAEAVVGLLQDPRSRRSCSAGSVPRRRTRMPRHSSPRW